PSEQNFLLRYVRLVLFVLRYGVLVFLVGFAIVALGPGAQDGIGISVEGGSRTLKTVTKAEVDLALSWWATAGVLAGCAAFFSLLCYWATSLKLSVEFQQLTPVRENARKFVLDILRLGMLLTAWLATLVLVAHVPDDFMLRVMGYVSPVVNGALVLAVYALV